MPHRGYRTPAGSAELYHRAPCASAGRTEVAAAKPRQSGQPTFPFPTLRGLLGICPPPPAGPVPCERDLPRSVPAHGSPRVEAERERERAEPGPREMDANAGSFVAARRLSGSDRAAAFHHSSSEEVVTGSSAWIGKGLSCVCAQRRDSDARLSFDLTPTQEECLQRLQDRIEVQYDSTNREHQEALEALWSASFPGTELRGLISEQWKEMGWQGKDPSTDFRGGGFISLENLLYFARNYPKSFQELLCKKNGDRAIWEYPFAVAGVNITFMLIQMLDLQAVKPRSLFGAVFLKFLSENDQAFDILYCITFKLMDQQWLEMHATYMDFNRVVKSTRRQLERELLLEDIQRIEDMPSYRLLAR